MEWSHEGKQEGCAEEGQKGGPHSEDGMKTSDVEDDTREAQQGL